jgi:hypothetical protein
MADASRLQSITQRAREDPAFFRALIKNPRAALKKAGEHWENTPENPAIEDMLNYVAACGGGETCSCTSGTCGGTCGGSTCDVTCSGDSCGRTCDDSCGYTTNLTDHDLAVRTASFRTGRRFR